MFTDHRSLAGEILNLLKEQGGPIRVREIMTSIGGPSDVINMSIGFLVREGMIRIETKDDENFVVTVQGGIPAVT